jgi:hypothetical protein
MMPGLMPGINVSDASLEGKAWMAGHQVRPAMTGLPA